MVPGQFLEVVITGSTSLGSRNNTIESVKVFAYSQNGSLIDVTENYNIITNEGTLTVIE